MADPSTTDPTSIHTPTTTPVGSTPAVTRLRRWWRTSLLGRHAHRPRLSPSDRRAAMDALMLRPTPGSLRRYAALLALSVVVSAMGLLQDSTAVVVGAMVIAPLMGPIMGIAASLVMGWGRRLATCLAIVVLSMTAAIVLAWSIAAFLPPASANLPHEILARASPDVRDLVVALAAGTAGAYATVRRDISGALPGVAVAVALVPPLATVGVLLGRGQPDLAGGAALLFVTNLFAIVLAAAVVFLATGLVPPHYLLRRRHRTLGVLLAVLVPTLAIATVLTIRFTNTAGQARDLRLATQVVLDWIGPGDELDRISLSGTTLQVNVSSPQSPPELQPLTDTLRTTLGRQITVDLRWIPVRDGGATPSSSPPIALDAARPIIERWLADQQLTLDGLSAEAGTLVVRASGPSPPRDSAELTSELADELAVEIPVSLTWTRASTDATPTQGASAAAATARTVADDWASRHPGTTVLAVTESTGAVTVTLTSGVRPDIADLRRTLTTALPQASITVLWLPSSVLSQDSPTPAPPTTPTPTPTPSSTPSQPPR